MVKFLAASDLHGSSEIAEYLSEKARHYNVDLVVLAGDINGHAQGDESILQPFLNKKQKILFIPGNWDSDHEHELLRSKAKSIHNYYVTYDGVGFVGFGVTEMKMKLEKEDEEILHNLFSKVKAQKKVFVSHLHAHKTKAEFSGVPGDKILRKTIETFKPDIFLAGHIHESEGIEDKIGKTLVFQIGRKGKIIEL